MDFRACSDEIPPCSFETAGRLLWRNTNNELLPVYDHQLCECCLQPQILRGECLGDNKWFFNQKPLIIAQAFTTSITQIWVKPYGIPQIWVNPQIWAITQNWGNHAQITQNWVLHLFLRVVIYLFNAFSELMLSNLSQEPPITEVALKVTYLFFHSSPIGVSELKIADHRDITQFACKLQVAVMCNELKV